MLLECPRCHFKQPQDQYCANCGVDMLAYKPVETPTHEKVLRSGTFQFLVILFLGFVVSYAVMQTNASQQWIQKINRFAGFKNSKNKTSPPIQEHVESSQLPEQNAVKPPPTTPAPITTQTVVAVSNTIAAAPTQKENQVRVNIQMGEMSRESFEELTHKAIEQRSEGDVKTGIILNAKDFSNVGFTSLKSDHLNIDLKQSKYLWVGNKTFNDSDSLGLNIGFLAKSHTDKSIEVDGVIAKKHMNDNLKIDFKLPKEKAATIFIAGKAILNYFEFEAELHDIPPFQIFKSDNYKNENSVFVIFIDMNN